MTKTTEAKAAPRERAQWDAIKATCGCVAWQGDSGAVRGIDFCPLHAAAPDLLAACKALIDAQGTDEEYWRNLYAAEDMARTAIAKAEGR